MSFPTNIKLVKKISELFINFTIHYDTNRLLKYNVSTKRNNNFKRPLSASPLSGDWRD